MPLYEYQCSQCEKVHEVIQKFSDAPLEKCPDCPGSLTKLVALCSFSLKGTGWYSTDYKKSPKAFSSASADAPGSSSQNSASGESSTTSSDASSSSPSASSPVSAPTGPSPSPAAARGNSASGNPAS